MAAILCGAVNNSLESVNKDYTIKPKQLEAISYILNGKDMLAILPNCIFVFKLKRHF